MNEFTYSRTIRRELSTIAVLTIFVGILSINFDLFEGILHYVHVNVHSDLDEIFLTSVFLLFSLFIFSYHLYAEVKRESISLVEANTNFQNIFDSSNDSIVVYRKGGSIVNANNALINKLGYTKDELMQMHVQELYDPNSRSIEIKDEIFRPQGKSSLLEIEAIHKDGSRIPTEVSSSLFTSNGLPYIISVGRDITERKRIQTAILEKNKAQEASQIKSEFLANMSHELRTPLNSIIGFSQLLNSNPYENLNENEIKYSYNIMNAGNHLLELINDILDISKVESGKIELEYEKFGLHAFFSEVEGIVQHLASKKNIEIYSHFSSESIEVYADRLRMKQILYNLLSNSVKFTPENGCV
ncbi:PAS domain S-box protein [Methanococcoides orientis]|uniref:sensor histidine kinase n=1 Tax=Methanococcoides orientis TaxID=2822137 RepID=UPI001E3C0575|nr:PAS domain S-box protein [Methanococcoides orientis]UGV41584.1 PAS domain S-box protein [Methanococcoides orientis]